MIKNGGRYAALLLGVGALLWLSEHNVKVGIHPLHSDQYIVQDNEMIQEDWNTFLSRPDVKFLCALVFITGGSSTVLPSDFNTAANTISCIGNGAPGTGGQSGTAGHACGGSASGC
jgi:hypothetical protein